MGFAPSDYIRAGQRDATDGFGKVGNAGERIPGGYETLAETRARLATDPHFLRTQAICDAAAARAERAFGRQG